MRDPSLTVDYVRGPALFLHSFKYSACKEYSSFSVIAEEFSLLVAIDAFAMEVILVVNEVDLHPCGRDGRNLDDKRSVHIVYHYVHSGKSDNLMKLVLSFVDASIARHE